MLSADIDHALIRGAEEGVSNCFSAPDAPPGFKIGAAVLTDSGNIYSAGYYKSDTQTLTLHAEQASLAHASAHGEHTVVAIAIAWNEVASAHNDGDIIYPCHMCKQLLWESSRRSGKDIEILITHKGEILERFMLSSIMSHTWPK